MTITGLYSLPSIYENLNNNFSRKGGRSAKKKSKNAHKRKHDLTKQKQKKKIQVFVPFEK